jgi:hypothetical protein
MSEVRTKSPASDLLETPALSVRRPGHWLNKWWLNHETVDIHPDDLPNEFPWEPDGTWICDERHVSREIAEEEALRVLRECRSSVITDDDLRYLGAIHFEDDS